MKRKNQSQLFCNMVDICLTSLSIFPPLKWGNHGNRSSTQTIKNPKKNQPALKQRKNFSMPIFSSSPPPQKKMDFYMTNTKTTEKDPIVYKTICGPSKATIWFGTKETILLKININLDSDCLDKLRNDFYFSNQWLTHKPTPS